MSKELSISKLKPFVKWAGGKTQFLEIINLLSPSQHNCLIEPFVGGGAVFFSTQPSKLIINDSNKELTTTYQAIRNNPNELIKLLTEYEKKHSLEFYEQLKKQTTSDLSELEIATRFIYLNKTGYNGLYRVNSQGEFNVPFGKKEKVKIFDQENILAISKYLNETDCQILNKDYQQLLPEIKADDFLFVDPPYDSENGNGFTSYTVNKFTRENQKQLLTFLKECEKKGAKWLLTNHATEFIKELYQGYWQFTKKAQRFINCQGDKRVGTTQEIFIGNYPLTDEQQKSLEFEKWFDSIQQTNIDLAKLVNWEKIQSNLLAYEQELVLLNKLICVNKKELEKKIEEIWETNPKSFQILPYLLAVRDFANFSWLDKENIEYWEELSLEKVKKVIFSSGLAEYLTNGQIKDLKDYVLGVEVGLGTHGRKNIGGQTMEKAIEKLLEKNQIEYQTQFAVDFQVNGKKEFDFLIKINNQQYYLETSFFNVAGSKVQEVIRSYSGTVLKKAQNNEINFLWILDGKGLKSCKELLKDTYFKNKFFIFTIASFSEWINKQKEQKITN